MKELGIRKMFVDGSDVCAWYELELDHAVKQLAVAEWFQLTGERISSIRMLFDSGAFTAQAPGVQAQTAVDPVCHMSVDQTSAEASADHLGQIYYFCSRACAVAFELEPDRFLLSSR